VRTIAAKETSRNVIVVVHDHQLVPTHLPARCVAYWNDRNPPSGTVSVPAKVDELAASLIDEYCGWTHELGETIVNGRSIREHLAFRPDFSFWWTGLIAEKAPLKSPAIYEIFKLRALERIYEDQNCTGLVYVGADPLLHETLRSWMRARSHSYERIGSPRLRRRRSRHTIASRLPHIVQALGYLVLKYWTRYRHMVRTLPSRRRSPQATIVTYFPNVDLERTAGGRFWSRYWEDLHDLLDHMPVAINWLWLYVDSDQASFTDAIALRDRCNRERADKYRHYLLDEFVTFRAIRRAVGIFAKSVAAARRLRGAAEAFRFQGSCLNFFPVLSNDWKSSLIGLTAMDAYLTAELFDAAAVHIGRNVWTLYTWENQGWEHSALAAWRRHGVGGRVIGVQHATLPALDLRAYGDVRDAALPAPVARPLPDVFAVNGSGAAAVIHRGVSPDRVVVTEALRYGHLERAATAASDRQAARTLLVITGFRASEAEEQLRLLQEASDVGALTRFARVWIKPHPMAPMPHILRAQRFTVEHSVVTDPLWALLRAADVVFVANSTSAVAEALYLGIPAAVCASADEMNMSPAFGHADVPMIANAAELAAFLQRPVAARWPADYLVIDHELPRWRRLLSA